MEDSDRKDNWGIGFDGGLIPMEDAGLEDDPMPESYGDGLDEHAGY